MHFPTNFPDIGGKTFKEVSENPVYKVFCNFVENIINDPTGIFHAFQIYLKLLICVVSGRFRILWIIAEKKNFKYA